MAMNKITAIFIGCVIILGAHAYADDWRDSPLTSKTSDYWRKSPLSSKPSNHWIDSPLNSKDSRLRWDKKNLNLA